jgi:hypothetical protein
MTVYYRGPAGLVTDRALEVWSPIHHRYAVSELRDLRVVRGGSDRLAIGTTRVAGTCAAVAVLAVPFVTGPVAWLLVGAFLLVPGLVVAVCWRFNRPLYALDATYHGAPVRIFETRDTMLFGQVRRGLLRAVEAQARVRVASAPGIVLRRA